MAAAMADPSVHTALVVNDVTLRVEDWTPYAVPVQLTRNFTVRGAYVERESWPTFDMNFVRAKVLLGPGVILTLTRIVAAHGRSYPTFQAPGMNLLANSNRSAGGQDGPVPMLLVTSAAMIFRVCLPPALNSASVVGLPRPPSIPGNNTQVRLPPWPNCINDTSARPMQRCWPAIGVQDAGFYALDVDQYGKSVPSGYLVRLDSIYFMCEKTMTDECVALYGTVGCFYRITAAVPLGGNSSSSASPAPSPPLASAARASAGAGADGVHVAPLVGGLAIGGLLLALAAASLVKEALKRRHCRFEGQPAAEQDRRQSTVTLDLAAEGATGSHASVVIALTKSGPGATEGASNQMPSRILSCRLLGTESGTAGSAAPWTPVSLPPAAGTAPPSFARDTSEQELLPVTPLTPMSPEVNLQIQLSSDARGDDDEAVVELLKTTLGKGASGRVVLGRYRGQEVAVKLLDAGLMEAAQELTQASSNPTSKETDAAARAAQAVEAQLGSRQAHGSGLDGDHANGAGRALAQEVAVLARCQHPNIIRLLAASLAPPRMCLVMERMDTSLERLLYERRQGGPAALLPLPTVLEIATQAARALSYLHPTVLHRDLKPANVLISQPHSARPVVKLADFGLSRLQDTVLMTRNPEVGTAPYIPPEAFDAKNAAITDRADVYALGVIVWEMLAGRRPWDGMSMVQVGYAVAVQRHRLSLRHFPTERCPPKLRSLISSCWDPVPQRRPAAAEIVKSLALLQEVLNREAAKSRQGVASPQTPSADGHTGDQVAAHV